MAEVTTGLVDGVSRVGGFAPRLSINQLLGHNPAEHDTLECLDHIEHTTGWVGGVRCVDAWFPAAGGGFMSRAVHEAMLFADFDRALSRMKFDHEPADPRHTITEAGETMPVDEFMRRHP